ncbi:MULTISPECIES: cell envelope biogenesis protein TolA [unclassified Mesorhizobium]|uniref:cell envelope biogenesis protein TolA n=1 Tax=unclassified Mesorhizobium TaxID=325217 RepID=UPI000BAE76F3|nr:MULTISPECIES: cell envelope biogenesis protein TolA [unclassified Mesorhizobium]PBB24006.1 cell envelope biogenesis protein TolA [Mesorhizobium sp. WSM4304]PBB72833.1 cell envelope biogenesis protein TolA [Mesorhizobium sp. WSM4308]
MPRKLKVFQTSQGFYDLAIAAPSMKAALEAWGSGINLFHLGFATVSDDPKVIAAAMKKPGVVLRRTLGTNGPFNEHADLPATLDDAPEQSRKPHAKKPSTGKTKAADEKAERRAAAKYEKERQRRDSERQKEEASAAKAKERRRAAVEKAEIALADAEREHAEIITEIDNDQAAVQRRADDEEKRWSTLKARLDVNLRKARGRGERKPFS